MHSLRLSRGLRDDECDVVSNSQLKVDVSTSDPITPGFPVSPHSLDPPLLSPLALLSTAHPLHSACSPNINSSRLCGIRNFPTVFSTRRGGDPSALAPQTRAIIEKPSPLTDPLLRRRSPRSFRPFHYETNQCFSLEKGSKRNSCSCTLSPSTLPLSSLSAVPYMRDRVSRELPFVCMSGVAQCSSSPELN